MEYIASQILIVTGVVLTLVATGGVLGLFGKVLWDIHTGRI